MHMTETDRKIWAGWIGFVTRYSNSNLAGVAVRDGFPVEIGTLEPEYYFARCEERVAKPESLLGNAQWRNFMDLCRRIRNGRISSLKIRDGLPVAGRGPLPNRLVKQALEKILAGSGGSAAPFCALQVDHDFPRPCGSGESPAAAPYVRGPVNPN